MKKLACKKHSSLFIPAVIDKEKSFITLTQGQEEEGDG
jgi:hypothetical protein